jgi:hypothetical protein
LQETPSNLMILIAYHKLKKTAYDHLNPRQEADRSPFGLRLP